MISVIIPAYDRQDYIRACLDSALNQSYADKEIIVVDDGSRDATGRICDSIAARHPGVRVIHQTNSGVSAARQTGIDAARGEWICFLDSDDTLPCNALSEYSRFINQDPDIIVSGVNTTLSQESFVLGISDHSIGPELWGKLYRSSFIKGHMPVLPRELVMGEDMLANLVLGIHTERMASIPDFLYQVNLDNEGSITRTFKRTFEYECRFFDLMNRLVLANCKDKPYYYRLRENVYYLKLDGFKNAVLDGSAVDINSRDWIELKIFMAGRRASLGPGEKLFLIMSEHQKLFRFCMKEYLKLRKK